jgi:hypothetical protein
VRGGPPKGGGVTPTPGRVLVAVVLCAVVPGPPRPMPTPCAAHGTKLFRPPTGSPPSDKYKNQTLYPLILKISIQYNDVKKNNHGLL